MSKKLLVQAGAVIKGILFIGFSILIILGVIWMCCNFVHTQDFAAPDTVLYGGMFRLLGGNAQIMYLIQLATAFGAGYFLMQSIAPVKKWLAIWRALVLLTFPFAMQCHLALQPQSLVGSLFLLMLAFVIRGIRSDRLCWLFGMLCLVVLVGMTGVADKDSREELAAKGLAGIMAGRMSWYTVLNDIVYWPEELQEMVQEVHFEATIRAGNMDLILDAVSDAVGQEKAREYYKIIAQTGWEKRHSMLIRQMGWDVLGYAVTPVIVPLQLAGEAYDSYTGRNYENMREAAPMLTKHYVNYSSWWFVLSLVLGVAGNVWNPISQWQKEKTQEERKARRNNILAAFACITVSCIWVAVLTLRGAGMMDYKWTIAVNQLWLVWAMLPVNGECSSLQECKGE